MMAPKVAVPMPSRVKPPSVSLKLPAPSTRATATVIRLRGFGEIDPVLDPDPARRRGDQAEHHDREAAEHRHREWCRISAPNFGEKPSRIAITAATTKTSVE